MSSLGLISAGVTRYLRRYISADIFRYLQYNISSHQQISGTFKVAGGDGEVTEGETIR